MAIETKIRTVPDRLWRSPSGRFHLQKRCSGTVASTLRVTRINQSAFEQAVRDGKVCRCVNVYKKEA